MKNYSLTVSGLVVLVVLKIFDWANVQVAPESVQSFVEVLAGLYAVAAVWYGRWRKGDITWYGKRKV